jgi:hypothetical protein
MTIPTALARIILVMFLFVACTSSLTTENPTNPSADDPLVLGEEVMPPWGCTLWRIVKGDDADC